MAYEPHRGMGATTLSERLTMAFAIVRTIVLTVPAGLIGILLYRLGSGGLVWETFDLLHWVQVAALTVLVGSALVVVTFAIAPVFEYEFRLKPE